MPDDRPSSSDRTIADGSLALMQESLKGEFILPSTEHALRDSFSGIAPPDYPARMPVVFFWEVIDGSHPRTSAAGIYMAGQMAPVIVAQYLDGLRRGQGESAIGPSLWWFLFAAAAIGFTGAIWGLVSLATWPTVSPAVGLEALQELSLVASPASAALILPAT
ncbi:hypothetical protein DL769_010919 [Monosporascus sp. CRB-8-3]|nr:hypothetical protein DL769_010919 [Monosporascus sp. CRB-8-3]